MTYRDHRDWHRCGACRTRRSDGAKLFSHLLEHPECAPCTCGGYHFPHRRGTTYCHANPKSLLAEMSRGGGKRCRHSRHAGAAGGRGSNFFSTHGFTYHLEAR